MNYDVRFKLEMHVARAYLIFYLDGSTRYQIIIITVMEAKKLIELLGLTASEDDDGQLPITYVNI